MTNWADALATADLELLARIIKLVMQYEQTFGRVMSPTELKAALDRA